MVRSVTRTVATSDVSTATPISATSFFTMATHELPTVRGAQKHYKEHNYDWQPLFDKLDGPAPAPSQRAVALDFEVPKSTLSWHLAALPQVQGRPGQRRRGPAGCCPGRDRWATGQPPHIQSGRGS